MSGYCVDVCVLYFVFFKQKTAYEMRSSDWSSDVCSSDLRCREGNQPRVSTCDGCRRRVVVPNHTLTASARRRPAVRVGPKSSGETAFLDENRQSAGGRKISGRSDGYTGGWYGALSR